MKFDHLSKGTTPHYIKTALEEEQKALLAAKNELVEQRLLFEEENNNLRFFLGDDEDMVSLNVSGTIVTTKRSTLGLYKDSALAKQFDDPLWTQKDKTTPAKQWSCEEVAKWVTAIEGMPDNVGATFVRNDVNGAALLAMRQENFKGIGVTKAGPLALLLKEIASLRTKAVFVNHNSYCFGKILDTLRLRSMGQSEKNLPSLYIQESHRERFNKLVDYYFPGESALFILQGSDINSNILSKHQSYQIESWLSEDGVSGDLELLYQGSRDGWKASDFHAKCDNKGATITVIRSSDGFIFGGFADKPWTSSGGVYCESDKAFLFSLKSPSSEVGLTKIGIKQNMCSNAMYHKSSYGPTFGGNDFYIASDANNNSSSSSILGHTYELPPGQTNTFLVGSKNFKVSEIEVFQII